MPDLALQPCPSLVETLVDQSILSPSYVARQAKPGMRPSNLPCLNRGAYQQLFEVLFHGH